MTTPPKRRTDSRLWQALGRGLGLRAVALAAVLSLPLAMPGLAQSGGSSVLRPVPQAAPAPAPVIAPPPRALAEMGAQIDALLARGQSDEARLAARRFLRQVTDSIGFGVTNAQLTAAPAEGFGMFARRADNRYLTDEPVYAYVEVYGFSMSPLADGGNRLLFDVAFTLETPDGRQVTDGMIPMGEVMLDSFSDPIDGFFHLTYRVTGASGVYSLRTEVIDRASGQRAEFRLPVEFLPPGAPAPGSK